MVEDAESGVASGRAGDFGLVVGVDRGAGAAVLLEQGADLVVDDLAELLADADGASDRTSGGTSARTAARTDTESTEP